MEVSDGGLRVMVVDLMRWSSEDRYRWSRLIESGWGYIHD
jgi:hypothetical protein